MIRIQPRAIAVIIFVLFFGLYFVMSPKMIYGSNDGSYYALLRSVDIGTFPELNESLMSYTTWSNYAEYEGKQFSDRPLGLALLAWPLHQASRGLSSIFDFDHYPVSFEAPHEGARENVQDYFPLTSFGIAVDHLVPIVLSAAVIAFLFLFFRLFTTHNSLAAGLSILFGLGTLFVKYATVFFVHNVSVFWVVFLSYAVLKKKINKESWSAPQFIFIATMAGASILMEYQLVLFVAGLLAYLLFCYRSFFQLDKPRWINQNVIISLVGGSVPIVAMMVYQYVLFRNPFSTTFLHQGFYLYTHTLGGTFSGNIKEGLYGLLFDPVHHGLFIVSPFLLLGLCMIPAALKKYSKEILLLAGVAIAHVLFMAQFKEWHGGSFYPRYIVWSAALLFMAGGMGLLSLKNALTRKALMVVFLVLGVFGAVGNFKDMGPFFSSLKLIDSLCPTLDMSACGAEAYTGGLRAIGWQKSTPLLEENFYIWDNGQAPKRKPIAVHGKARALSSKNIQGRGGDFIYPDAASQKATVEYAIPPQGDQIALQLSADFTIVGDQNYIQADMVDAAGKAVPVFMVRGQPHEQRYWITRQIAPSDIRPRLRFTLYADKKSVTLADARLSFFNLNAIRTKN